jgi:hypothetical protein
MFCCAGLFGGLMAGAATGIPWMPFVTAAVGAGGGLLVDIKVFRALDEKKEGKNSPSLGQMCCDALRLGKKKKRAAIAEVA